MSAKAVELAEAIVDRINGGTYELAFRAKHRLPKVLDVENLTTLLVSVYPGTKTTEQITRGGTLERIYKPVVAIHKRLQAGTDEETELAQSGQLQELVAQIEARLANQDLASLSFVGFEENEDREPYSIDSIKEHKVFAATIGLQYME